MKKCCWLKDFLKVVQNWGWTYYVCVGCGKWYRLPGEVRPDDPFTATEVLQSLRVDANLFYWRKVL